MIFEEKLKDGAVLQILRVNTPEERAASPKWVLGFAQSELPFSWRHYYQDLWDGKNADVVDCLYAGMIDGIPVSRMWFAYSTRTGSGNFGNVKTLPEYRRRGIMSALLKRCVADFRESGAKSLTCDAAAAAAPAYAAAGFQRLLGDDKCPMGILQTGTFAERLAMAYADTADAKVRPGEVSDRFDCDKLLYYVPEVHADPVQMPEEAWDYLGAWRLVRLGEAKIAVLEARSGICAGYAFRYQGKVCGRLHPGFAAYREALTSAIGSQGRNSRSA